MSDTEVVEVVVAPDDEASVDDAAPVDVDAEPAPPASARRRDPLVYSGAFAVGALLATLLFASLITGGNFDFGRRVSFGDDFYDVQARRLFDGRWDMPLQVVAVEGYTHDGEIYMYFGPTPAFLRMPLLAATDVDDGEMTQELMVVGFAVAMVALGGLGWRIRRFARGNARVGWSEAAAVGIGALGVGAGSTLLYLGSGPWVYHEAILWGIAFSLAAFDALLAWLWRPRWWVLALAALFAALAVGSRLTVGLGPVIAMAGVGGFVLLARVWPWARREVAPRVGLAADAVSWWGGLALGAAAVLPLALYGWMNTTKFGTLFSVPYDHQLLNRVQENRAEVLARNDDTLVHLYGIPVALYQYLRPDAIGFRSEFPWLQFPEWKPSVPGDLLYDWLDRTSSLPAAMPLLSLLAVVGIVAVVCARRRRPEQPTLAALRVPVLATVVAVVPTLMFIFLTQRYTGDFVPMLVLGALAGFFTFAAWAARQRGARKVLVGVAAVVLVALAAWSVLANYGMARDWQRDKLPDDWGSYAVDDR